jgi:taurine dioxygenase
LLGIHMDLGESILNMLYEWVKKPEFMVRFRWEKDSVAMWDNCATQHYAVFDYAPHYRAGQRMTCGKFTPSRSMPAAAGMVTLGNPNQGTQGTGLRKLLDGSRMQFSSASEQQAVDAIFSALEGMDLGAIAAEAGKR